MEIKKLEIGLIISESRPMIILGLDGNIHIDYKCLCKGLKNNDVVLFEDSGSNNTLQYVISIKEFHYYSIYDINLSGWEMEHNNDKEIYNNTNHVCVPIKLIKENEKFILDLGNGSSSVLYCKVRHNVYANWIDNGMPIIRHYLNKSKDSCKSIIEEINEIEESINHFNINQTLEKFLSRPGKDDYYFVDKVSTKFEDKYIDSLFPTINECIYKDYGYCEAHTMAIELDDSEYDEEVKQLVEEAKQKYDKDKHRLYLLCEKLSNYMMKKEKYYNEKFDIQAVFFNLMKNVIKREKLIN